MRLSHAGEDEGGREGGRGEEAKDCIYGVLQSAVEVRVLKQTLDVMFV